MNEIKQIRLLGNIKIEGEIEAVTGLHIGGTADAIDKGGIDSPVIKNPVTNEPYIPGSSLRGRMRSLLEKRNGKKLFPMTNEIWMEMYDTGEDVEARSSEVCRLFGNSRTGLPSVLLVRDALYTPETRDGCTRNGKYIGKYMDNDLPVTEAKMEIVVDRITAHAVPRTIERVPSGARFAFAVVYRVQEVADWPDAVKNVPDDLKNILWALKEIQNHDGLGGNTARGHGVVRLHLRSMTVTRYDGQETVGLPEKDGSEDEQKDYSFEEFGSKADAVSFLPTVHEQTA
ncbi:MAG: type III-A CRISPR-associated RAMP protein Csm3 [Chlorobiaceae bacterium]|nr:type III-A CRISPR-associated RAMP protein Csm3 [Chlorobiaceae bacterium]